MAAHVELHGVAAGLGGQPHPFEAHRDPPFEQGRDVDVDGLLAQRIVVQHEPVPAAEVGVLDEGPDVGDVVAAEVQTLEVGQLGKRREVGEAVGTGEQVLEVSRLLEAGEVQQAGSRCPQCLEARDRAPGDRLVHEDKVLGQRLGNQPVERRVRNGDRRSPVREFVDLDRQAPGTERRDVLVDRVAVEGVAVQPQPRLAGRMRAPPDVALHQRADVGHVVCGQVEQLDAGQLRQPRNVGDEVVAQDQFPEIRQFRKHIHVVQAEAGQIHDRVLAESQVAQGLRLHGVVTDAQYLEPQSRKR